MKNMGTLGRIEGKVDVLTELVVEQNKRIDGKVGWAPFGIILSSILALFIGVSSFFARQLFRGN